MKIDCMTQSRISWVEPWFLWFGDTGKMFQSDKWTKSAAYSSTWSWNNDRTTQIFRARRIICRWGVGLNSNWSKGPECPVSPGMIIKCAILLDSITYVWTIFALSVIQVGLNGRKRFTDKYQHQPIQTRVVLCVRWALINSHLKVHKDMNAFKYQLYRLKYGMLDE